MHVPASPKVIKERHITAIRRLNATLDPAGRAKFNARRDLFVKNTIARLDQSILNMVSADGQEIKLSRAIQDSLVSQITKVRNT